MGKFWLPFVANATHLIIIKTIILTANIYRYWAIFLDRAPDVPGYGLEQTVGVAFPFDLLCVLSLLFVFSDCLFFFNFFNLNIGFFRRFPARNVGTTFLLFFVTYSFYFVHHLL